MITKKRLRLCQVQQRNVVRGLFVREFLQLVFIIFPSSQTSVAQQDLTCSAHRNMNAAVRFALAAMMVANLLSIYRL
jgi:hypothetical protein